MTKKISHPHLAAMIFNTPLMIQKRKLQAIIRALGPKIGALDYYDPGDDDDDDPDDDNGMPMGGGSNLTADGISVIPVYGTLVKRTMGMEAMSGLTSYESLCAKFMDAATNPDCKAILMDYDTRGGGVEGAFDCSDLIYSARQSIPVYGIANCSALSAGYLLASSCEKLFITQDGYAGSIGVIAEHCDQSGFDEKMGMKYTTITFGDRKADFNEHAPLSDDATTELQADVDRFGNMFVAAVARNRGLDRKAVLDTQAGYFGAREAMKLGLVDAVGVKGDAYAELQARTTNKRLVPMPGQMPMAATAKLQDGAISLARFDPRISLGASASAAAISQKEGTMPELKPADPNTGTPPDLEAIRKEQRSIVEAEFSANAAQIRSLCDLAGKKHLANSYIESKLTPALVQEALLKMRADDDGPELQTEFLPQGQMSSNTVENPHRLMNAVNRRLKARGLTPAVRSY